MRRLACFCLMLALLGCATRLLAQPAASDPDLVAGIRAVEEGDFETALSSLGRAVRTLSGDASRSQELAQAHLYLGIAYVYLDQEKAGRASFREALKLQKDVRLGSDKFPPKVVRAFDAAVQDALAEGAPRRSDSPALAQPERPTPVAPPAELLSTGGAVRPFLGIMMRAPTDTDRTSLSLPDAAGALVIRADDGGPASEAGLRTNDVVRKVDGRPIRKVQELAAEVPRHRVGDVLRLEVWRDTRPAEINVRIGDRVSFCVRRCQGADAAACSALGEMFARGDGVLKDPSRAAALFNWACGAGDGSGCASLGTAYAAGSGVPLDASKAADLHGRACDRGELAGCVLLGVAYADGTGVAKNDVRAVELFRKACEAGNQWGCVWLGTMCAEGRGVPKDLARAVELFRSACDGGAADGCTSLGLAFAEGKGVAKKESRAAELYTLGCDAGDASGCGLLGVMYEFGRGGLPKDKARALELYRGACADGHTGSCKNAERLGR